MSLILSVLLLLVSGMVLVGGLPGGGPGGVNRRLRAFSALESADVSQPRALLWRGVSRQRTTADAGAALNLVLAASEVATLLRSGASPRQAWWDGAQIRVDQDGVPLREHLVTRLTGGPAAQRTGSEERDGAERQAAGVLAACALAGQIGAPLAPVLEAVARSAVHAQEARTERDAALAGPRSTARLLAWLPLVGFGLALALGANPLGFLFGSVPGLLAGTVGAGLMIVGHKWSSRLFARARRAGELE